MNANEANGEDDTVAAKNTVDNGDGSYSYVLPDDFDPAAVVQDELATWSYVGQAEFTFAPERSVEETYTARVEEPRTLIEKLMGTVRLDANGRLWSIVAVDETEAHLRVAHAMESSVELNDDEDYGTEDTGANPDDTGTEDPDDGVDVVERPGDIVTWHPQSWDTGVCTHVNGWFTSDDDSHYYMGDDDRAATVGPLTVRQQSIVEIRIDGFGACTGTIIRSQWVLTAAHCLYDVANRPLDLDRVTVNRRDGAPDVVHGVLHKYVPSEFTPFGTDPADDYAMLELTTALSAPYGDMDLSQASEDRLKDLDAPVNLALPAFAPYCVPNVASNGTFEELYLNTVGGFGTIMSEKINLKLDGSDGHSGSPVFYCPEDSDEICAEHDQGYVIAVWSGWNGFTTTHVGARVSDFFGWGISLMDGT